MISEKHPGISDILKLLKFFIKKRLTMLQLYVNIARYAAR